MREKQWQYNNKEQELEVLELKKFLLLKSYLRAIDHNNYNILTRINVHSDMTSSEIYRTIAFYNGFIIGHKSAKLYKN